MAHHNSTRPPLSSALDGVELLRWYWLKDELIQFARGLGVRTSGGKRALSERLAAHLDGRAFTEPPPIKTAGNSQLSGVLTASTVIPRGQRCSQVVRAWLAMHIGPSFHFDAAMRQFFGDTDGTQTLEDALEHWRSTRGNDSQPIDAQFEYNRFTRTWRKDHPQGERADLLEAWGEYRSQPVDLRGRA